MCRGCKPSSRLFCFSSSKSKEKLRPHIRKCRWRFYTGHSVDLWVKKRVPDVETNEARSACWYSHPHPLIFTESTLSVVVFSISVVKLANSSIVALYGNVKLTLSSINSTNCTYMWVHLNTSDVQPSRQELHEQFNNPVKSSRRVVRQSVGRSMKSPASADRAGSKRQLFRIKSWGFEREESQIDEGGIESEWCW